jgi:glutamyl-tRNA reductase
MVQETLSVAKEVRTGTALGKTSVSMAAIAAKLAQQIFGDLDQVRLLLIGAGEMIELTATHFAALSPKDITIANRTLSRGTALAQKFDAHATALDQLPHTLHQYDVVISSTASSLPLIGKGMVERAMIARKRKPLFLVDLAMPRDIEPEVSKIDGVFLHSLDSLGRIAGENLEIRQSAIEDAQRIIDRRTADFMHWLDRRSAVPVIQKLREKAEQDAAHEIARGKKLIAGGADPAEVLAMVARALTNKHLHRPLTALQRATGQGDDTTAAWIEALFIGSDEMKM